MKFIYADENSSAIKNLFQKETEIKCAVAFWGSKVIELISGSPERIKIICNIESGATNPYVIEKLIDLGVKVKTNKKLHAKVYLALDELAIVGSANASANGLSYEDDEIEGWLEASIQVNERTIISEINSWFDCQWKLGKQVTLELLEKAKEKWHARRNQRELEDNNSKFILDLLEKHPEQFNERNIFISVYRVPNPTQGAINKFNEVKEQIGFDKTLTFWQDWSTLPENSYFISLYYGPRGGFRFDGYIYIPPNKSDFIKKFMDYNKQSSEILICFLQKSIKGLILSDDNILLLKDKIDNLWKYKKPQAKDEGIYLSLYESRNVLYP